jgi:hypothetical protein
MTQKERLFSHLTITVIFLWMITMPKNLFIKTQMENIFFVGILALCFNALVKQRYIDKWGLYQYRPHTQSVGQDTI